MPPYRSQSLVRSAIKSGARPAERLYNIATARGFAPKTASDTAAQNSAAEIARIKTGQAASQSLRGAGTGSGVGEGLTVAKLASMSDGEFDAARSQYIAKHGKVAWTNLTGVA